MPGGSGRRMWWLGRRGLWLSWWLRVRCGWGVLGWGRMSMWWWCRGAAVRGMVGRGGGGGWCASAWAGCGVGAAGGCDAVHGGAGGVGGAVVAVGGGDGYCVGYPGGRAW